MKTIAYLVQFQSGMKSDCCQWLTYQNCRSLKTARNCRKVLGRSQPKTRIVKQIITQKVMR